MSKGLYPKYRVTKTDMGEEVKDCFVLRPDKDPAAVRALMAYANATEDTQLAKDLFEWVKRCNCHKVTPLRMALTDFECPVCAAGVYYDFFNVPVEEAPKMCSECGAVFDWSDYAREE